MIRHLLGLALIHLSLNLNTALAASVNWQPLPQARAASPLPAVVPQPTQASFPSGLLPLDGLSVQVVGNAPELTWALRDLQTEWKQRLGQELKAGNGKIVIGTVADSRLAAQMNAAGLKAQGDEGYALWVDAQGAYVVGATPRGAYYGAQTLRQLLTAQGLRFAKISDAPALRERMAMIYLDQFSQGVNDRLIPMLAQLKYNRVLIMSNYVQWDTAKAGGYAHPGGASKAEAKRIADLARSYGLEPIPLIETLGHVGWMFYVNKNLDLRQDEGSQNPYAYDTLNPATYDRVILPILKEAVEVFKPQYIHLGHDEVRSRDRFPARDNGKAVGFEKLFTDDVLKLYGFLKSQNVGTMIWHDTAFADSVIDKIPPQLPKDLRVAYWNYTAGTSYETLGRIAKLGFPTYGASWLDLGNAESQAQTVLKYGGVGAIQTRWTGYFGNPSLWDGQAEQALPFVRAGNAFWNPSANPVKQAELYYRELYQPSPFSTQSGLGADLSSLVTRSLKDDDGKGWIQKGADIDLRNLPTGQQKLGPYTFQISGAVMLRGSRPAVKDLPDRATIEIGRKAQGLVFLHTTGWPAATNREAIGRYEIEYSDGSKQTQPLEYGRHLRAWTDLTPSSMVSSNVWTGKTADGLDLNLTALEWSNPKPELVVRSVTLISEGKNANPTLLGLTLLGAQ